jgi:apolipoprotein N-acyltransferase
LFTQAVLAADLPLRTARTVADRVGAWPEYVACAGLVLMLALFGRRQRRR